MGTLATIAGTDINYLGVLAVPSSQGFYTCGSFGPEFFLPTGVTPSFHEDLCINITLLENALPIP